MQQCLVGARTLKATAMLVPRCRREKCNPATEVPRGSATFAVKKTSELGAMPEPPLIKPQGKERGELNSHHGTKANTPKTPDQANAQETSDTDAAKWSVWEDGR